MSGRVVSHVIHHGVHFMSQVSFVSPALLRGPVEKLQVLVLSVTVSRQIRGASDLKKKKRTVYKRERY